ncbi:hypothetical protein TomMM35A_31390 [Sphingobium sp. TomMM35A]
MILNEKVMLENPNGHLSQRALAYRQRVATRPALLLPGAAIIVFSADPIVGAAAAALDQPRKQMPFGGLAGR